MIADAIAREDGTAWMVKWIEAAAKQFEKAGAESSEDMAHWAGVYNAENARKIAAHLTDIPAADRLAQRERHAALAREIARGHGLGEMIARAILEDRANG